MKKLLNLQDQQELAAKLLKADINVVKKVGVILPETNLLLVMLTEDGKEIPARYKGGVQMLIDNKGEVLFCSSSDISVANLVEEYKNGRRTPINSLKK